MWMSPTPNLIALKAMLEVREEMKAWVELQIVAFPQEGILSYPNGKALLEEALRLEPTRLARSPISSLPGDWGSKLCTTSSILPRSIRFWSMCTATRLMTSSLASSRPWRPWPTSDGIGHGVTASHTTAMHSYNGAYASRLFRLLKMADINFVANPLVNIHLQGRFDTYPKRRGIAQVKEMLEANINVCFRSRRCVQSLVSMGTANMLQVLHSGAACLPDHGLRADQRRLEAHQQPQRQHP